MIPSSSKRKSQVFVEIPPSPLHSSSRSKQLPHMSIVSSRHKENALHSDVAMVEASSSSSSLARKRKLSDRESLHAPPAEDVERAMPQKKAKLALCKSATTMPRPKKIATDNRGLQVRPSNATEEFPNGSFYCHQCNKKRDISIGIQCTFTTCETAREPRCKVKYCKMCLKNRYGEDMDEIVALGEKSRPKDHIKGLGYIFRCFKCQDTCNCRNCRKAKGLEPTGNLTHAVRKTGADSAAAILGQDPSALGILPGKGQQTATEAKPRVKSSKVKTNIDGASKSKPSAQPTKAKVKVVAKPKPVPNPRWTAVPTSLDLSSAESRIYLREFVLRFSGLLDIAKTHMEELEELDASHIRGRGYIEDEEDEEEECAWASEPCVKAIILGLLSIFIGNEANSAAKKVLKDAAKDIRSSGANLTKMWSALAVLREDLAFISPSSDLVNFPDPLPPPSSATFRNTRSGLATAGNGIHVAQSWQLIPLIVALVDVTMSTKAVREELQSGAEEHKHLMRDYREQQKKENERWESESTDDKAKPDRVLHKQRLADLEQSMKMAMTEFMPRFAPLGRDTEGRVYWALPPGPVDRTFASTLLADPQKAKISKKAMISVEDRKSLRQWSWFVAVWGKRPPMEEDVRPKKKGSSDEDMDEEDDGEEKWWGFWEPKEIKTLAEWISVKSGLDDKGKSAAGEGSRATTSMTPDMEVDAASRASSPLSDVSDDEDEEDEDIEMMGPPSNTSLKGLVKGLKDYGESLQWRIEKWQKPEDE